MICVTEYNIQTLRNHIYTIGEHCAVAYVAKFFVHALNVPNLKLTSSVQASKFLSSTTYLLL